MSNNPLRHLYASKRWKELRLRQLAKEPLCRMCQALGLVVAANTCDHIVPHRGDVEKFWGGPFQSLCRTCHSGAKQQLEKSGTLRGCSQDGVPFGRPDW